MPAPAREAVILSLVLCRGVGAAHLHFWRQPPDAGPWYWLDLQLLELQGPLPHDRHPPEVRRLCLVVQGDGHQPGVPRNGVCRHEVHNLIPVVFALTRYGLDRGG